MLQYSGIFMRNTEFSQKFLPFLIAYIIMKHADGQVDYLLFELVYCSSAVIVAFREKILLILIG